MNYTAFNKYCQELAATHHVIQWGDSHVWKVGGKVFAVGGWGDNIPSFTFKTAREDYDFLVQVPGVRPAPYLASRGMSWVQNYAKPGLPDKVLKEHLRESHRIVSLGLTKKLQKQLGLNQSARHESRLKP